MQSSDAGACISGNCASFTSVTTKNVSRQRRFLFWLHLNETALLKFPYRCFWRQLFVFGSSKLSFLIGSSKFSFLRSNSSRHINLTWYFSWWSQLLCDAKQSLFLHVFCQLCSDLTTSSGMQSDVLLVSTCPFFAWRVHNCSSLHSENYLQRDSRNSVFM